MHDYIAFLRAINVGTHLVRMEHLRQLFSALGFQDVATFIASGNVIFRAPHDDAGALETQIETHLRAALGYEVVTFLRTFGEVTGISRHTPFADVAWRGEAAGLYVGFLRAAPGRAARRKVEELSSDLDCVTVSGRELYWLGRKGFSTSTLTGARLEKVLGMPMTLRNMNTVKRLAARYPAAT